MEAAAALAGDGPVAAAAKGGAPVAFLCFAQAASQRRRQLLAIRQHLLSAVVRPSPWARRRSNVARMKWEFSQRSHAPSKLTLRQLRWCFGSTVKKCLSRGCLRLFRDLAGNGAGLIVVGNMFQSRPAKKDTAAVLELA